MILGRAFYGNLQGIPSFPIVCRRELEGGHHLLDASGHDKSGTNATSLLAIGAIFGVDLAVENVLGDLAIGYLINMTFPASVRGNERLNLVSWSQDGPDYP